MTPGDRTPAIEIESAAEHQAILALGLRLRFDWTGDRWTHALDLGSSRAWTPVVGAMEGEPTADDPGRLACPAYQQLQLQPADGGAFALLVGQVGAHHVSASFGVRQEGSAVRIDVDVADRCRLASPALACTYRIDLPAAALSEADPDRIAWRRGGRLSLLAAGGAGRQPRLALAEAGRSAAMVQALAPPRGDEPTQRLYYSWTWEPARDDHDPAG